MDVSMRARGVRGHGSTPERTMRTVWIGLSPRPVGARSTARTTSMPSMTFPNATWRPLSQGVGAVVMKNCDPFVFGPALAMDKTPGPTCGTEKVSSANFPP